MWTNVYFADRILGRRGQGTAMAKEPGPETAHTNVKKYTSHGTQSTP